MAEWNEGAVVARRGVAAGSALSCCRGQRCRRRPVQVWKVCYIICSQLKNRKKRKENCKERAAGGPKGKYQQQRRQHAVATTTSIAIYCLMHLRKFMQIPKNTYFTLGAGKAESSAGKTVPGKQGTLQRRLSKDKRYYSINFILARSTNHRKRRLDGWRKRDGAMLPGILNEAAPTKLPALGSLLKVRVPYPCPSFHSQYRFLTLSPFFIPIFLLYFFFLFEK